MRQKGSWLEQVLKQPDLSPESSRARLIPLVHKDMIVPERGSAITDRQAEGSPEM